MYKLLNADAGVTLPGPEVFKEPVLKNIGIPKLDSYMCEPDEDFWNYFLKKDLPKSAETTIERKKLRRSAAK